MLSLYCLAVLTHLAGTAMNLTLLTVDGKIFLYNGFVVSDFLCNFALQIIILHTSLFTLHSSLLTNERIQSYIEVSSYG